MKLCSVCHQVFADEDTICPEHGERLKPDPLIGTTLSSFKITGWLGEGGMGILYRATHDTIGRKAAVKVIKREFITDQTMAGRFEQEARAVAKIGHPHLIDIFDIGTTPDERIYYIMELLEGRALSAKMADKRLTLQEFAPLFMEACDALEAAHAVGIVHRDLKPDNIFLIERPGEPPFVKVLDFGVAKVLGTDEDVQSKLTRTGSIVGTPQYMAPEQIDGSKIDGRADIYAMGVILYELCTGKLPFQADTLGGMLKAHLLDQPAAFDTAEKLSDGVNTHAEAVTFKAITKKPEDRYQSIRELRDDLDRVMRGDEPLAAPWWIEQSTTGRTVMSIGPGGMVPSTQPGLTNATVAIPGPSTVQVVPPQPKSKIGRVVTVGLVLVALVPLAIMVAGKLNPPPPPPPQPQPKVVENTPPPKKRGPDMNALRSKALGVITTALKDGDPVVRKQAAEVLGEGHDPRHHTLLSPLLQDIDPQVQAAAATTLGSLGARPAIPALKAILGKDQNVDTYAAEALMKMGDEPDKKVAWDTLKKVAKKGEPASRLKATMVLFDNGEKESRRLFEQRSKDAKPDDPVGINLLGHLAQKGDEKAHAKLVEFLDTPEEGNQLLVAETLARMGDERGHAKLTTIAEKKDSQLRLVAYRILASIDDHSGYDLFSQTFGDSARPMPDRVMAAQGLGASGERSVLETMTPALDDQEPALRLAAAGAVLAIAAADPRALAARSLDWASTALGDSSWAVRANAVSILGDADAEKAVPLLGQLIHDDRVEVRRAAVAQLGKTKSQDAVKLLEEALSDDKAEVRMAALRAMGQIGGSRVAPILAKHLETASEEEKVVAAAQLAKVGDKSHVEEIKNALVSKNAEVRRIALEESAGATPELTQDAVQVALKDKSFAVRFEAASQLADKGSKEGENVLQEAVKKGGADGMKAFAQLAKLGVEPKHQIDPEKLLDSPNTDLKLKAVELAQRLPKEKSLSFYKRALKNKDSRVRLAALGAVGETASPKAGDPGLALIKSAIGDEDAAVRAKAGALYSKLAPPVSEDAAPAPKKVPTSTQQKSEPTLRLPDAGAAPPPDLARPALPDLSTTPTATAQIRETPKVAGPPDMAVAVAVARSPDMATIQLAGPSVTDQMREDASLASAAGELALRTGHYVDAIRDLQRAHRLDPTVQVFFSLGEAYRKQADRESDPAKRLDDLERAIGSYKKAKDKRSAAYAEELEQLKKEP